jgi:PIN domain nuclease of toxin-antitoxin system
VEWRPVKLLLDTHAFLWWAANDAKLPRRVVDALVDATNDVFVSAASAWEISTKVRLGKLHWPSEAGTVEDYAIGQSFLPLAISVRHAEKAGSLAIAHGDPFDRMLIAQATGEGLLLVSNEVLFDSFGAHRFW